MMKGSQGSVSSLAIVVIGKHDSNYFLTIVTAPSYWYSQGIPVEEERVEADNDFLLHRLQIFPTVLRHHAKVEQLFLDIPVDLNLFVHEVLWDFEAEIDTAGVGSDCLPRHLRLGRFRVVRDSRFHHHLGDLLDLISRENFLPSAHFEANQLFQSLEEDFQSNFEVVTIVQIDSFQIFSVVESSWHIKLQS
jgi:hypothetical protein